MHTYFDTSVSTSSVTGDAHARITEALGSVQRRTILTELQERSPSADRRPGSVLQRTLVKGHSEDELVTEHLPTLERHGYIEWNSTTGRIERGQHWAEIGAALKLLAQRETGSTAWDCVTCGSEAAIGQYQLSVLSDTVEQQTFGLALCEPCLAEFRADETIEIR
jgi:hypothetical protein